MILSLKQREIKFRPRIKLNHDAFALSNHHLTLCTHCEPIMRQCCPAWSRGRKNFFKLPCYHSDNGKKDDRENPSLKFIYCNLWLYKRKYVQVERCFFLTSCYQTVMRSPPIPTLFFEFAALPERQTLTIKYFKTSKH